MKKIFLNLLKQNFFTFFLSLIALIDFIIIYDEEKFREVDNLAEKIFNDI